MSVQLELLTPDGKKAFVDADSTVFAISPNQSVLHLALRRELANARSGTAASKTRAMVRGGGKKPWKQKGTGRARVGSIRSPLWVGGGVIFGPQPRDFQFSLNKKVRRLAIKSALSSKQASIRIIKDFSFISEPKTKLLTSFFNSFSIHEAQILVLANYQLEENANLYLASRNLPNVKLSLPHNLSVKDILSSDFILMTESSLNEIQLRYSKDV
ncbi:MAG: 50S ribosomal protein L4 [Candidatus Melainabacteria bacterium]|nr:50S ribosomal protein L4 [Candidatus Melainabacteria bacterium]